MGATTTFLFSSARSMLVLHALVSVALAGASTHLALVGLRLWRGERGLTRLARIYAQVVAATFVGAFALGLLIYPTFRYHVRGVFFDRHEPWASNLFDMKENVAALGLPCAIALFFIGRRLEPDRDPEIFRWFALASVWTWLTIAFTIVSGLVVTSVKSF
ncbi:MAG: hypothetical protein IPJ65_43720 [Archangiaceae bacterium]|nr:hypothetical protein [Archangiaceae bacterium]